jgi:hypothetical protein
MTEPFFIFVKGTQKQEGKSKKETTKSQQIVFGGLASSFQNLILVRTDECKVKERMKKKRKKKG